MQTDNQEKESEDLFEYLSKVLKPSKLIGYGKESKPTTR